MIIHPDFTTYFSRCSSFAVSAHRHQHRLYDQKITPDVVSFIADTIIHCTVASSQGPDCSFTWEDLRLAPYFRDTVMNDWGKVDPHSDAAKKEYDKFIRQPLLVLEYAGLLQIDKTKKMQRFSVINVPVLALVARGETEAAQFLMAYLRKVLKDNDLEPLFDRYLAEIGAASPDLPSSFKRLRDGFVRFWHGFTAGESVQDASRIFMKVYNLWAWDKQTVPAQRGFPVANRIASRQVLRYGSRNWRDTASGLPTGMARNEFSKPASASGSSEAYRIKQAKKAVTSLHKFSEVLDSAYTKDSIQVHHMMTIAVQPIFADVRENLICLTPTQHNSRAHPQNHTNAVCEGYLDICLHAKAKSVVQFESFYDAREFARVTSGALHLSLEELAPQELLSFFETRVKPHRERFGYRG